MRRLVLLLPLNRAIRFGGAAGWVAYFALRRERRIALRNLEQALPEVSPTRQRRKLVREVFRNCGRGLAEVFWFPKYTKALVAERVSIVGSEHLLGAYARGQGFICLSAHFGNWELLGAYVAQVLGIPFGVVARDLKNPRVDELVRRNRQKMGINVIMRGKSGIAIYRRLGKGECVGILGDQDTRGEGIFVNFFGQLAYTQNGIGHLCVKTGADIIPIFIIRNPDKVTHTIYVEPPLRVERTGDHHRDVQEITQNFTKVIEGYVRRYPAQWMWFHRRWRRKPPADLARISTPQARST